MKKKVRHRILELHEHNPDLSCLELARAVDTSQWYVQAVLGIKPGKDQFGLRVGTALSKAAAMFVEGCTMQDVKEACGATKYMLLRRLKAEGHQVITRCDADGRKIITLIPNAVLELGE